MKLLYVQDSLGTGGAERSQADLWYYITEKHPDLQLKVVVLKRRSEGVQKEVVARGIEVVFVTAKDIIGQVRAIANIIKSYDPDLVHSVLLKSTLRVRMAKLLYSDFFHLESLVNTTYIEERLRDPALSFTKFHAYRYLDAITSKLLTNGFHAITDTVAAHHVDQLGIAPELVHTVQRGRNKNNYQADRARLRSRYQEEWEWDDSEILFVSTGRQEFQKGQIHTINAFGELYKEGFEDFKYVILGRDGHASTSLKESVKKYRIDDKVVFAGHRSDVEEILAAADVFLFPSIYEGLGVSLIEAQAAGLPIIANDIEVFREVTLSGKNAILIDVDKEKDWQQAILSLARDRSLRDQMKLVSIKNFEDNFVLDDIHRRMVELYHHLLGRS